MSTAITLDMITEAWTKRGVKWRYYKTRADALTHNRNDAGNNASATPGGWGPIRGLFVHNFASDISDASSLDYLYRGDAARELPGPLSQFGLTDEGVWVVLGWGAANHASAGDSKVEALARGDKMPLDRDCVPNPDNAKTLLAPFYLGVEMLYGKAPTTAQRTALVKGTAAIMDVLGDGYTGGSVVMHRETHATRSDPVGFKGYEIRKAVNAQLAEWNKPVTTPVPPATDSLPKPPAGIAAPNTYQVWYWDGIYEPYRKAGSLNPFWTPASYLIETYKKVDALSAQVETLTTLVRELSAKVQ